jgi:hypothetical protein
MTDQEQDLLKRIRNVSNAKALAAAKEAMSNAAKQRFDVENAARAASIASVEPVHNAMRDMIAKNDDFRAVREALAAASRPKARSVLAKPFVPVAAKAPRLKIGSVHLVDTAPFEAMTWNAVQVFSGPADTGLRAPPAADGTSGAMGFNIAGGGAAILTNSSVSCWCAIGQSYIVPEEAGKPETGGSTLRFSASPSLNWSADWGSSSWRLASGNIWIGQVVNQYDQNWVLIDTPVSYQQSLKSWNDYNLCDNPTTDGSYASYGLSTSVFIQPGFNYDGWVWIGATAYGDGVDSGDSYSRVQMDANVNALIFDSF